MNDKDIEIVGLFPTPVGRSLYKSSLEDELTFALTFKTKQNIHNKISIDNDVLSRQEFQKIREFIDASLFKFTEKALRLKDCEPYVTISWLNFAKPGEFHHLHRHPNSYISGVFYLSTFESDDRINFTNPTKFTIEPEYHDFNIFNSNEWYLNAVPGLLILFPSTLEHRVVRNDEAKGYRISLSFNTFLKGKIGRSNSASYLNL